MPNKGLALVADGIFQPIVKKHVYKRFINDAGRVLLRLLNEVSYSVMLYANCYSYRTDSPIHPSTLQLGIRAKNQCLDLFHAPAQIDVPEEIHFNT